MNDQFRSSFAYRHVYRRFRLIPDKPVTWDGGIAVAKLDPDHEDLTDNPPFWESASDHAWLVGQNILPTIPMVFGYDYVAGSFPFEDVRDYAEEDRPFAVFRFDQGGGTYRWADARYISQYGGSIKSQHPNGWDWSAEVHPLHDPLKFDLHVIGAPQMVVDARTVYFDGSVLEPDKYRLQGHLDWRLDELHITLALHGSHFCEWTENAAESGSSGSDELDRQKLIAVGDNYRLDRIAIGTIIGINPQTGVPITFSSPEYVRDDRPQLAKIAKRALQWYGKDRKALHFSTSWVTDSLQLGNLLLAFNDGAESHTTNSVITQIVVTMPIAMDNPPIPKIEYATSFAELDVIGGGRV
jgi:hypothetical protein